MATICIKQSISVKKYFTKSNSNTIWVLCLLVGFVVAMNKCFLKLENRLLLHTDYVLPIILVTDINISNCHIFRWCSNLGWGWLLLMTLFHCISWPLHSTLQIFKFTDCRPFITHHLRFISPLCRHGVEPFTCVMMQMVCNTKEEIDPLFPVHPHWMHVTPSCAGKISLIIHSTIP